MSGKVKGQYMTDDYRGGDDYGPTLLDQILHIVFFPIYAIIKLLGG